MHSFFFAQYKTRVWKKVVLIFWEFIYLSVFYLHKVDLLQVQVVAIVNYGESEDILAIECNVSKS